MTYASLDPKIREIAKRELTTKQLDVWKLHLSGCGRERIALMLSIHKSTVRSHLVALHVTLARHGVTLDDDGYRIAVERKLEKLFAQADGIGDPP